MRIEPISPEDICVESVKYHLVDSFPVKFDSGTFLHIHLYLIHIIPASNLEL